MTYVLTQLPLSLFVRFFLLQNSILKMKDKAINAHDRKLVRYDAWFMVLAAILMTITFVLVTALAIWCVVYKGKRFSGNWQWSIKGVSIRAQCV